MPETLSSPGAGSAYLSRRPPGASLVPGSLDRNPRSISFGLWDAPPTFGDRGARGIRNWQRNDFG